MMMMISMKMIMDMCFTVLHVSMLRNGSTLFSENDDNDAMMPMMNTTIMTMTMMLIVVMKELLPATK